MSSYKVIPFVSDIRRHTWLMTGKQTVRRRRHADSSRRMCSAPPCAPKPSIRRCWPVRRREIQRNRQRLRSRRSAARNCQRRHLVRRTCRRCHTSPKKIHKETAMLTSSFIIISSSPLFKFTSFSYPHHRPSLFLSNREFHVS